MQKVTIIVVPLNELKLSKGMHQIAYQVRVLQDGKPVEHICAPKVMVSVGKAVARDGNKNDRRHDRLRSSRKKGRSKFREQVDGKEFRMPQEITVRVPVSRQVRRQVPSLKTATTPKCSRSRRRRKCKSRIRTSKSQIEEMQAVPWTPPRTIRINFATTRNVVNPTARDATRFGNEIGRAELRFGARGHFGFEDARRAAAVAGTCAADAAGQLQSQPALRV